MSTLTEKITKKQQQIEKLERLLNKYLLDCSAEETDAINYFLNTGDRSQYRAYLKNHNLFYGGDAWSRANDLYDARQTLIKYEKQLKTEADKQSTLNELPEVLQQFKNNLINRWDEFDMWKRDAIKSEYKNEPRWTDRDNYRQFQLAMRDKWGRGWYDFMTIDNNTIHKNNVRDADNLILNMINRVIEKTGKIIDASGLHTERDNCGYTIINGTIIGESGTARIESIGAGGYNIQRYHIRVLVK